jgi:hypothetical protein
MTFQTLKEYLVQLENQWDEGLITDQEFDNLAAQAAMKWARQARKDMLGQS